MGKKDSEKSKSDGNGAKDSGEKLEKKKKKKQKSEGSRWAALVILALTLVAGVIFYVVGNKSLPLPDVSFEGFNLTSEYVIE